MDPRFAQFPRDLAMRTRPIRLGSSSQIPALVAHPDWERPAPLVLWMHGRTVNKELDPGRYLRWVRAGVAAVAIDLPGHGERLDPALQHPSRTLEAVMQAVREVDEVFASLAASEWAPFFDFTRAGIGGMSAGGMVTLRRICDPAPATLPGGFKAVAVEGTTGWIEGLYNPERAGLPRADRELIDHPSDLIKSVDAMQHIQTIDPVPLLVLHSEADRIVPWAGMSIFLDRLRAHYVVRRADPSMIEIRTWPETGAPQEHAGFGRFANDAKNAQVEFLARRLSAGT
jgi:dienelactone hydrolase